MKTDMKTDREPRTLEIDATKFEAAIALMIARGAKAIYMDAKGFLWDHTLNNPLLDDCLCDLEKIASEKGCAIEELNADDIAGMLRNFLSCCWRCIGCDEEDETILQRFEFA